MACYWAEMTAAHWAVLMVSRSAAATAFHLAERTDVTKAALTETQLVVNSADTTDEHLAVHSAANWAALKVDLTADRRGVHSAGLTDALKAVRKDSLRVAMTAGEKECRWVAKRVGCSGALKALWMVVWSDASLVDKMAAWKDVSRAGKRASL